MGTSIPVSLFTISRDALGGEEEAIVGGDPPKHTLVSDLIQSVMASQILGHHQKPLAIAEGRSVDALAAL